METNRLKQFCAIAELGSMSKAAQLLHITHSGLSKSMRLLQDELGITLLCPSGRGIALTEDGLLIYQRAKEFLEQQERLFRIEKKSLPSSLKIGTVEIFLAVISGQLKKYPFDHHSISLLDLDPGKIEHLIADKQLDFGITYAPFPAKNIEITEIGQYRLGCYYLNVAFKNQKISDIPFVVPAQGLSNNLLNIKERDGWLESIHSRNKKYNVNLLSTAIELTLQGLCAIYIPDFVARNINQSLKLTTSLTELPLPKNQKNIQSVFMLRHKDRPKDATFKQLCKMVKETII